MDKKHLVIGFLIIALIFTALYSVFFLIQIKKGQPNRAKLVIYTMNTAASTPALSEVRGHTC